MDVDRDAAGSLPAPAKAPVICTHVWTQLTPEKAQCQRCQLTVPTVPEKDA
jgi:hypothetical protein